MTDNTGNVRGLCFEVLDFEPGFWKSDSKNFIDINRVWAEAKYLFDQGESYQLTTDERGENEEANKAHRKTTLEEDLINQFCKPDPNQEKENHKTATQIMNDLSSKSPLAGKTNRYVLSKALIKCGLERKQVKIDGNPRCGYYILL